MKKIISAFTNKREVSINESGMRFIPQWLLKKTRTVVFVDSGPKEECARMPKPFHMLIDMDDEDENVFIQSIHERYEARTDDLEDLCLADFVTR